MTYREFYKEQCAIAKALNKEESAVKTLFLEISGISATEFYLRYCEEVPEEIKLQIINALHKYFCNNIPVQYILGYTYFHSLKLKVNPATLIPRPETELLVEMVVKNTPFLHPKIIDMGTGSGAIAIALKHYLPNSSVTAVDISSDALTIAEENAKLNSLDIKFIKSDLFSNVSETYDILISNPPYIPYNEEIDSLVYNNEPHSALFAADDGLYFYQEMLKHSPKILSPKNMIAFEIPENKDQKINLLVKKYYPNSEFEIIKDFNNKSRILIIKNNWR